VWKGLSDAERQVYIDKQTNDRVRYEREMAEAGLPLTKERPPREPKPPKERPARKPKKAAAAAEEEDAGYVAWYVPDGFTLQEQAPSEEELAFAAEASAADSLVGRRLLYKWAGVGWCEGVIEERNTDARLMLGDDFVTFWCVVAAHEVSKKRRDRGGDGSAVPSYAAAPRADCCRSASGGGRGACVQGVLRAGQEPLEARARGGGLCVWPRGSRGLVGAAHADRGPPGGRTDGA
jgi:hypothetical protein